MAITYQWTTVEPPEVPIEQKVITASQTITKEENVTFTLKEKQAQIEQAENAVVMAEQRVTDLKKELEDIKIALKLV